uniref:Tyrosine specific protein phosphatases domain-containing protein n=1 Tax=viral metagenome TaxID=1070528 RepID=A0A6C0JZI6_9ZZZZ
MRNLSKHNKKGYKKSYKKTKRNKKAKRNKRHLKGGIIRTFDDIYPPADLPPRLPAWRVGGLQWSTLVKVRGLNFYGTSLPPWDERSMENIFRFLLFRKDIRRVLSLQGCGGQQPLPPNNIAACQPDVMLENRIFNETKQSHPTTNGDPSVQILYPMIPDMTPGSLVVWDYLSAMFNTDDVPTVVHCLAGLGRTGSVLLLFIMLRYHVPQHFTEYMGQGNSAGMFAYIRQAITYIEIDNNLQENGPQINQLIAQFQVDRIREELMDIHDLFHTNIMIARINYIVMMVSNQRHLPVGTPLFLYRKFTPGTFININMNNVFVPEAVIFEPANWNQANLNGLFTL